MNVLMLSWEYPPNVVGGLGAHVAHLAPIIASRGDHVHVVTPRLKGGEPEAKSDGLSISRVEVPEPAGDFVDYALLVNRGLFEQAMVAIRTEGSPWLLHAHDWLVGDAAIRLHDELRLPLLATIHATEYGRNRGIHNELQQRIHEQELRLANAADRIIACSRFMAQQIRDVFAVLPTKLEIIPNGVDAQHFQDDFDRAEFRRQFAAEHEHIILHVGRLVAEKGIDVVLDAMPKLLELAPNVKVVIVGSGPALDSSRTRAAQESWAEHIIFTGFVSDEVRNRLYQVADAAMFPSLYEPFGIVALEAMAAGVPVVVSNSGGLAEVVDREETGVVVEAGSPDALAWGVVHVLEQPELSKQRAQRAYVKATTEYNWNTIAEHTARLYERLLEVPSAA